jgi:transposase-like protein
VLLHMMTGSKEDAETVTAFFEDMKRRGLNDPLLVTSDDRKRSCDRLKLTAVRRIRAGQLMPTFSI